MNLRHEIKYLISNQKIEHLDVRLKSIMQRDDNDDGSGYYIRSLYFDDYINSAYTDKRIGIYEREKFRIRIYDENTNDIYLEKKKKYGALINKQRCNISKDTVEQIINGNDSLEIESNNKLLNEFIIKKKTRLLQPKQLVDYYRKVYVCEAGNVRITFDQGLEAPTTTNIFDFECMRLPAIEDGYSILEVKYDYALPNYIAQAMQMDIGKPVSSSKYCLCRMALESTGRILI